MRETERQRDIYRNRGYRKRERERERDDKGNKNEVWEGQS